MNNNLYHEKYDGSNEAEVFRHEVMIHNADHSYPEDLENVLRETLREATPEEDFLTDKIYRYCRETGDFLMYKGTVFIDLNKLKSDSEENG